MNAVAVGDLRKSYRSRPPVAAVDGVSFTVAEGEFYTLVGPSGCGKTTTMRCIAGLETPDSGTVMLDGETVFANDPAVLVRAERRNIGMVFQSYAIWPHMTVFDNVAFPLRVGSEKVSTAEMKRRVEEALALVALEGYGGRLATELSGGQQQRLALARALVRRPRLLLLDEPLSNLDARLRDRMREELRLLQRDLGVTTIYVTHDQAEALSMSSRIAVMDGGRIVQEGRPHEVYAEPASRFVAEFLGNSNVLAGRVLEIDGDRVLVETPVGALWANRNRETSVGDAVAVSIRPEDIVLSPAATAAENTFESRIRSLGFLGDIAECVVESNGVVLRTRQRVDVIFHGGDAAFAHLPATACVVIY